MQDALRMKIDKIALAANELFEMIGELEPGSVPMVEDNLQAGSEALEELAFALGYIEVLGDEHGNDEVAAVAADIKATNIHDVARAFNAA